MIDRFFHQAAEKIVSMLPVEANQFLSDLVSNNVFQRMTEQELRVACIEIALKALALAVIIWISAKIRNSGKKKKNERGSIPNSRKKFKPKKWKPDGRYYDEDKKKWIEPDY